MGTKQLIFAVSLAFAIPAHSAGLGSLLDGIMGKKPTPVQPQVKPTPPKPSSPTSPIVQSSVARVNLNTQKSNTAKPAPAPSTSPQSNSSTQSTGNVATPSSHSVNCGPTDLTCKK